MDVVALSEYIVRQFSHQSPGGITPMKLQKLLYYIKVWTLVAGQQFVHANFEHWDYGPVNRQVYNHYKSYGSNAISPSELDEPNISGVEKELVDFILENYISFDAFTLSAMTHIEEPWKKTQSNEPISDELIISYYRQQRFAKNFQPFDLSNNPFYPIENYSFIIDMAEKDAQEITEYPSYENYKNALREAEQDFNEQWSNLATI